MKCLFVFLASGFLLASPLAALTAEAKVGDGACFSIGAGDYSARFDCHAGTNCACGGFAHLHRRGAPPRLCLSAAMAPVSASSPELVGSGTNEASAWADWSLGRLKLKCRLTDEGFFAELAGEGAKVVRVPAFSSGGENKAVLSWASGRLEVRCRDWLCLYESNCDFVDTGRFCSDRNGRHRVFELRGEDKLELKVSILKESDLADLAQHPRLFATQAEFDEQRKRLNSAAEGRLALERLLAKADGMLDEPTLERTMIGRRLLKVSRDALDRISTLSFAWKMTGERKYADRAVLEARKVSSFPDWNPSHFLDVAEMTLALAIARDWLDEVLDEADKRLVSEAILLKGLTNSDRSTLHAGWLFMASNNWNQVCNGGLAAGAAAVREDYPHVAAAVLRRARATLPAAMSAYEGGNFPEGISYWQYATDYNVIALDVFRCQFADGARDLFSLDGFAEQTRYPDLMTGADGVYFNFSDPYHRTLPERKPMASCWYLADRFDDEGALESFERSLLAKGMDAGRMTALMLLWYRPKTRELEGRTDLLCRALGGVNPVAVMRSGIGRNGWYLGVKAGTPSISHAHMDAGSFVFDCRGVRWAVDLPCEEYNRIEQMKCIDLWKMGADSSRWSLFRLNTHGHGTLMVDDMPQAVEGTARIIGCCESPDAEIALDLTEIYPAAEKVVRTFRFERGVLSVKDEITGLKKGSKVSWNMNTLARAVAGGNKVKLYAEDARGDRLSMELTVDKPDARWEVEDLGKARSPVDTPNEGVNRIRFSSYAGENGTLSHTVFFGKVEKHPGRP